MKFEKTIEWSYIFCGHPQGMSAVKNFDGECQRVSTGNTKALPVKEPYGNARESLQGGQLGMPEAFKTFPMKAPNN